MCRVAIVGVSCTPRNKEYMRYTDSKSWKDYVIEGAYGAIKDVQKGMNPRDLQYAVVNYHGEASVEAGGIGPVVADILGLHPMGVTALCANCTGAGVSMHDAYGMVASGMYKRVLALGFDKRYDLLNFGDKRAIGGDVDYDFNLGYDHPGLQGLLQAYAYQRWGRKKVLKAMAAYRIQSNWWANRNPLAGGYGVPAKATFKDLCDILDNADEKKDVPEEFWAKLPGNFPTEGSSAVIMVPADDAYTYTDKPIFIDAITYSTNSHLLSKQMYYNAPGLSEYDMCDFASTHIAAKKAYEMADMTVDDIDFAQVFESHITSLIPTLAATQVTDMDHVLDFIIEGGTGYDGRMPTGTDGGRGGFGFTSGSNFTDGVFESVIQMRGEAGERQLKKTDASIVIGMQGEMASSTVAILRKE